MYFFDFLSPILDAFFFTVPSDRPNLEATLVVGLLGKSFLSKVTSLFDHKPLTSFFFAIA
jgi:fructose-specific phosphotransferase system IIC component